MWAVFFYYIWTLSKLLGSGNYFLPSSSMLMPSNFQLVYKPMCILNEMNTYILDSFTLNSPRWFKRHPITLWVMLWEIDCLKVLEVKKQVTSFAKSGPKCFNSVCIMIVRVVLSWEWNTVLDWNSLR